MTIRDTHIMCFHKSSTILFFDFNGRDLFIIYLLRIFVRKYYIILIIGIHHN